VREEKGVVSKKYIQKIFPITPQAKKEVFPLEIAVTRPQRKYFQEDAFQSTQEKICKRKCVKVFFGRLRK